MMQQKGSAEKGTSISHASEAPAAAIVVQPPKLEGLLEQISRLEISERAAEDRSGDMGGGGTATAGGTSGAAQGTSWRDQAIANIPQPAVMRMELRKHIEAEVKVLQREIRKATRKITKPGAAYRLNELYARLRRLNSLLSELVDLAYEVLRRLFVRVVIDKQKVL